MTHGVPPWVPLVGVAAVGAAVLIWVALRPAPDGSRRLEGRLPGEVGGWSLEASDRYDRTSIFGYIDGHAEVYLAYDLHWCLARRYRGPDGEPDLVLDVFRLATPADAFGVLTHQGEGGQVNIGQGGRLSPGWLSFWQGPFFVSVYAEGESPAALAAVSEMGRLAAAAIEERGEPPAIWEALPDAGLDRERTAYLHHPLILEANLAAVRGDPFGLSSRTPAVVAHYEREGVDAALVVVDYPEPGAAHAAFQRVLAELLPEDGGNGLRRSGDGSWGGARVAGRRLAVVLGAAQPGVTTALLDETVGGDP
ncbi:MAG: hypothetical protein LJE95_08220 [Acidobacteria bacterium]|jgi:hypothetical protein|nr:hypothetical protein [Acidobacteriota bacterium]